VAVPNGIREILARKSLPAGFDPAHGIASLLPPRPCSIRALQDLPPKTVTFDSGGLSAGGIEARGRLMINADGFWFFTGDATAHAIVGASYAFGMALMSLVDGGDTCAAIHTGVVHGTLVPGKSSDSWQDPGFDARIRDQWDVASNSSCRSVFNTVTAPGDVIGLIVTGLAVAGVSVLLLGGKPRCRTAPNEQGGQDLICQPGDG
jgi:hypothetical protein